MNPTNPMRRLRAQLFHILHKPSPQNPLAKQINYFLTFLILTNALSVTLETMPSLGSKYQAFFVAFEDISTILFAIEYIARIWVCVEQERYAAPITGRIRYALNPLPLLDLIVISTFWLPIDLRFLRIARIVRLLKVLHLEEFHEALERVSTGLAKRRQLIIVSVMLMLLSIYASSAMVYQLEHAAQPDVFSSIPATLWWALETLTTIGYGDMIPITSAGRFFAGLISVFGIGVFALPMAIITAVILEAGSSATESAVIICRHCGRSQHEDHHER